MTMHNPADCKHCAASERPPDVVCCIHMKQVGLSYGFCKACCTDLVAKGYWFVPGVGVFARRFEQPPVHGCPMMGDVVTSCCGVLPFELPPNHRMTLVIDEVTCKGRPRSDHEQGRAIDVPIVRVPLRYRAVHLARRFAAWWNKKVPTRPLSTYDDAQDPGRSWQQPADPDVNHEEERRRALVLQAIADGHHLGYDIGRATKLRPGRLYPILHRLLEDGELVDEWEGSRRLYRIAPHQCDGELSWCDECEAREQVKPYLDELHRCTVLTVIGHGFHFGDDISKATGLPHAKVYAVLDSLLERGEVIERWEETETETTRRTYHLNDNPDLRMRIRALSDPTYRG